MLNSHTRVYGIRDPAASQAIAPHCGGATFLAVVAKNAEANAILGRGDLAADDRIGPFRALVTGNAEQRLTVVVSGVGPTTAAAAAAVAIAQSDYDLVLSVGIGGAIPGRGLRSGQIVVATEIVLADLGIRTADRFTTGETMGWTPARYPTAPDFLAVAKSYGAVPGHILTCSAMTGTARGVDELKELHPGAWIEAMEGAGVAAVAAAFALPVAEVRAVSNEVGPYDKSNWDKPSALRALGQSLRCFFPIALDPEGIEENRLTTALTGR